MSIVEGTHFECFIHTFKTDNPDKFEEHRRGKGHYDEGHAPCLICGEIVNFTADNKVRYPGVGRPYDIKCDKCIGESE